MVCPFCGFNPRASVRGYAPSIVIAGPDPQTGEEVIRVDDPSGVRSEARRSNDGGISLSVSGAAGIGRPGEGRAAHTFKAFLIRAGCRVEIRSGKDEDGVDRLLEIDGRNFILQLTVTPQDPVFWQQAKVSSATKQVSPPLAASWLRDAIVRKRIVPKLQAIPVILAIDIRHAGPLANEELVEHYLTEYGAPVDEFGFASVWLIGPAVNYCYRVGHGLP